MLSIRNCTCRKWPAYGRLPQRKYHCKGSGKRWPIGTTESKPFTKIALVDGAPDFLAIFHFLLLEQKQDTAGR